MTDRKAKTILIVEDEALIRMLAVSILVDAGFQVIEAANADQALVALDTHPEIQAMFTDINMPGELDGFDLAKAVHTRWPDVHLLLTSGKAIWPDANMPSNGIFLPKPYSPDSIADILTSMLN